jgi:hypothetical protein
MNWIAASVKRLFSRRHGEAAGGDGDPSAAASNGLAHLEKPPTERPGLDEWIRTFDLDKEKARLAEDKRHLAAENARLWSELIAKNGRLDQTSKALLTAEQSLRGALDRASELIEGLLPNIELLRDSREVLRIGLSSRRSALTALRDISARPDVVKGTRVQAADGWLERHFNTGDRPNGRIYYRYRGERCSVLVSFKAHQAADIEYLQTL